MLIVSTKCLVYKIAAFLIFVKTQFEIYCRKWINIAEPSPCQRVNAEALQRYGVRISAQLQNIAANMSNVLAETFRLRTSDAASADGATNQVADRLRDLNADMDAFQRLLDTALVQTGAAMAS